MPTRAHRFISLCLCAVSTGCSGPASPPAVGPPVIALITIDTWRVDHFSMAHTPHLWSLATQGLRFERAYSPIGLTTPAHVSMWTGLLPWEHGVEANNHHGYRLAPDIPLWIEGQEIQRRGAFVSAWPAGPDGGLDRGWEVFDGPQSGERTGAEAVGRALAWLPPDEPAILWVHLYEPHGPYEGHGADDVARYAEEVQRADALLEPLLSVLVARGSRIVVAADHGEVLLEERCGRQHERSIHDVVLRVPLFRWSPEDTAQVRTDLVGLTDVPTLLSGEQPRGRSVWLAESGTCEPGCAPGCAPSGLSGRDRVAIGPKGRMRLRPGAGAAGEGVVDPAWLQTLEGLPPVAAPEGAADLKSLEALGYLSAGEPALSADQSGDTPTASPAPGTP